MASITVRNLDESTKAGLRIKAARHGHSMEQEVREILRQAVAENSAGSSDLAKRINRYFTGLDAEDIPVPARQNARKVPLFDKS